MSRRLTDAERVAHSDFLASTSGITTSTDHFLAGIDYARSLFAEVLAAARASLAARDLAEQMAADDRLHAALAACEPETRHEPV
ncbi:hypothetical protein B9Y88_07305 [Stenotrophomonas maltophilia]|uniref:hypothetical protein n=1 Tax=Stenotrophomonas TaxID=40323 RepID=UPI000C26BA28|nr:MULTISPECIES: hypothetical protein [unclassified Stenotrophomonas]MCU1059657.1 hypothetical protein [Stenotrophomonas maltophilia]MDH1242584.1 hypothetical protein [Stenotrophomonas sp. GD03948]MDH1577068.1 hypothetical protein [Stenotrophomonas sp. GD03744]PJL78547.1 hypothetical protein B9Y88_07305 [Stenotrophomonas maltophilia]PZT38434.1 hypothetical protein A7X94_06610 [Stenotrophomonas maltophilia]